jgi:preprotein translocase subunit SecE
MARTNPLTFIQQVRSETAKVTWPSRREVGVSTVMVLVLTTLTAVFFFLVDFLIRSGLGAVLDFVG